MRIGPNEAVLFQTVRGIAFDDASGLILTVCPVRGRPDAVTLVFDRGYGRLVGFSRSLPDRKARPCGFELREHVSASGHQISGVTNIIGRRAPPRAAMNMPFHSITSSPRASTMFFSFMQQPISVDGLVKIFGGVEPDRIHEPGGREVRAEEVGPSDGDCREVGSPE